MKAITFQDDISSNRIDNFKNHYVLVFDLTSMQVFSEDCHQPEFVGEPLKLELNFTFSLEHVTEFIVLGERMSSVAVDKFGAVGNDFCNGHIFAPADNQPYPITQVSVLWFIYL